MRRDAVLGRLPARAALRPLPPPEGGATGTVFVGVAALVFLLVHLPWTYAAFFGDENPLNPDREFSPVQWTITLFVIPLVTAVVARLARREAKTGDAAGSLR
jgi:hypothetical protein